MLGWEGYCEGHIWLLHKEAKWGEKFTLGSFLIVTAGNRTSDPLINMTVPDAIINYAICHHNYNPSLYVITFESTSVLNQNIIYSTKTVSEYSHKQQYLLRILPARSSGTAFSWRSGFPGSLRHRWICVVRETRRPGHWHHRNHRYSVHLLLFIFELYHVEVIR